MNNHLRLLLLPLSTFLGLLLTPAASGQNLDDDGPVVVYHINGVLNTPEEAMQNMQELMHSWLEFKGEGNVRQGKVSFGLNINPTDGALKDFIEGGNQAGLNTSDLVRQLLGTLGFAAPVAELYLGLVRFSVRQPPVTDALTQQFAGQYVQVMNQGNKVILVPHSQGNFFANNAFKKLTAEQQKCVWVVSVATPVSEVPTKGTHSTLIDDYVIYGARLAMRSEGKPEPLPQVTENDPSNTWTVDNSFGHSFTKAYLLLGTKSRTEILDNMDVRRRVSRLEGTPCATPDPSAPETPGPEWTFMLREAKTELYAQASCEKERLECAPYYQSVVDSKEGSATSASGISANANSNVAELTYSLSAGSGITATVSSRHEVHSVAGAGPDDEMYYPYGTAKSNLHARWSLNATGRYTNGALIPIFTYRFTGTSTSKLTASPSPFVVPDESEDPYPGIWLCPFPRLFFVNTETGASYITQVGDVGGSFDVGGSIAAGQYSVSLMAGADQLTLTSGQMDNGQYPPRSLKCEQTTNYHLEISHP